MRLQIDHRTVYRFSEPQTRLVQMLRMTPQNHHDQTVAAWRIDVDCDAKMRDATDGFGNMTTMLYVEGPVEEIEISVSGEVLTTNSKGVLHGATEIFPEQLFLRSTALTPVDEQIAAFADEAAGDTEALKALHRVNRALRERFTIDPARPEPGLTAAKAFVRDSATIRDMAQMFLVAARHLGAPARYVSGYRLTENEGLSTPHGWAEAYVAGMGWIAFDPSTGRSPEEEYVRVANALDSAGTAAVAGSRLGEGDEVLDVDITVSESQ
ncbi:MAG: transglutaminase family protein [Sphingomonas bacterium]|nr:transglutaminase family protein [Sphingomonas bacterium]